MAHITNLLRELIAGAVVLGVLVLLHEWGHFIAAKLCGVRVDVFSIGFGSRIWGWKRGDTDYRISWLPLGGYVKMAGDNPADTTGAPYEFLSRPRWQRFLIAIAGPAMNILTTLVIFWGIYAFIGMPTDASLNQPANVVAVPDTVEPGGVQAGDRIVEINGAKTANWDAVETSLDTVKPGQTLTLVVLRDGQQKTLHVAVPSSETAIGDLVGYPPQPAVIDEVAPGLPAEKAGMQDGDKVIAINGKPVVTWYQLTDAVHNSEGKPIQFVVQRGSQQIPLTITPTKALDPDAQMVWQVGVVIKESYEHQTPLESGWDAILATNRASKEIGEVLVGLFAGKVSMRDLAGPVGIVRMSGQAAKRGASDLLELTAVISLNLGLLNLLPIPILDGGHVLLLLIEAGMRREMSLAFKERFVQVGLVFILGVFAFVMYSDILKAIQGR